MADETPRLWICEACGANLSGAPGLKCPFCGHLHEHGQQPPGEPVGTAHAGLELANVEAAGGVITGAVVKAVAVSPEVAHDAEPAPEAEPQPEPVAPVVDHVEAPAPPPSAPPAAEPASAPAVITPQEPSA